MWASITTISQGSCSDYMDYIIEEDNDTTNNAHWGYLCKIFPYLLKYRFDLFGLIDAGLTIDKTTLTTS